MDLGTTGGGDCVLGHGGQSFVRLADHPNTKIDELLPWKWCGSRFAGYRRIVARGRHITLTPDAPVLLHLDYLRGAIFHVLKGPTFEVSFPD